MSEPCHEIEFFYETHQFYHFTQKLPPLEIGGHEIYNFLFLYHADATYQIWSRLAQWLLTDDGRKPIAKGHLSDSDDLK